MRWRDELGARFSPGVGGKSLRNPVFDEQEVGVTSREVKIYATLVPDTSVGYAISANHLVTTQARTTQQRCCVGPNLIGWHAFASERGRNSLSNMWWF